MKLRSTEQSRAGFTLIELLVVLAILAGVTTLALRSLDEVQDQRRYEASRQMLEGLEKAVLGGDGAEGFAADLGRLPHTVLQDGALTLAELWQRGTLPAYDVRSSAIDPEVLLPTGWRGPYLRLPLDAVNLFDGWGYPMSSPPEASPANPATTGYHRLRDMDDAAIFTAGQPVGILRHLGANGAADAADTGVNRDLALIFASTTPPVDRRTALVKATVQVFENDGSPAAASPADMVYVRVFTPDPLDASQLKVVEDKAAQAPAVSIPAAAGSHLSGITAGPRAVRAYLIQDQGNNDPADDVVTAKSAIKHVTLRPGVNFIPLTIHLP